MGIFRTDDPIRDFMNHERQQESWLARRPMCDYCEEHIQDDHYFEINGEVICPDCLEAHFRKEIE